MFSVSTIISFVVSIIVFSIFLRRQLGFYVTTNKNVEKFNHFFAKEGEYETIDIASVDEELNGNVNSKRLKNVALPDSELYGLIKDINEYLESCKGTATFNIIQNKTERRIAKMYDLAASRSSFPTYYGLMGTFAGVFIGLLTFLFYNYISDEGITDDSINSLISGVLVSMSTSFIGLLMSTHSNDQIGKARDKINEDKNEFYEYIQNKLMPSVDISLTEALGKLHETVSDFEPDTGHESGSHHRMRNNPFVRRRVQYRRFVGR